MLTGEKKEIKKCASTEDFYVWELFASDIYRRPTSTVAKSPYFFSYAFHHDGVAVANFQKNGQAPIITKHFKSFENADHHWDKAFHPFVQNQWVEKIYCESKDVPLPPVKWSSNTFRLTTDDDGVGILCTKRALFIGVHFYSTGTGINFENFGMRLFFRLRKLTANTDDILKRLLDKTMGRPVEPEPTHYGDTGDSIDVESSLLPDIWDNSLLDQENQGLKRKHGDDVCLHPENPCKKNNNGNNQTK